MEGGAVSSSTIEGPRAVTAEDMRRWVQVSLNERRRRAERQLGKSWKRTTPDKAARVVVVGEALVALLKQIEEKEIRP